MTNEFSILLRHLSGLNTDLMGAPVGILLYFAILAIGYAMKASKKVPNNVIPIVLICCGLLLWLMVAEEPNAGTSLRNWFGRNIMIGLIIPCAAWLTHRVILKRLEKKLGVFKNGDGFETEVQTKPPGTPAQQKDNAK